MVRFQGTPPYATFVEYGERPYDDQPSEGILPPLDVFDVLSRHFLMRAPLLPKLRPRPLAAIILDIDRATIPAIRPEEC